MVTVSVCMIVKNEAAILSRCLDSLQGIYDELIIVDTGSTDRTVEIAKSYTDKVYSFPWVNDFSAARNESLRHATSDYLYVVDADEVLTPEGRKLLSEYKNHLLEKENPDIVQMYYTNQLSFNTVYNYDEELRPKLYKRSAGFRFENPVHEAVRVLDSHKVLTSEIRIKHLPQSLHGSRDLAIFVEKYGKEDSPSMNAHLTDQYARELFICGQAADFYDAETAFLHVLQDPNAEEAMLKKAALVLMQLGAFRGNLPELMKYSLKVLAMEGCSEAFCILGDYYYENGDFEEAAIWYYNAAYEVLPLLTIRAGKELPLTGLVKTYQALGLPEVAADYESQLNSNGANGSLL